MDVDVVGFLLQEVGSAAGFDAVLDLIFGAREGSVRVEVLSLVLLVSFKGGG